MLVEGDNVGLATLEYKGLYSVHWYYTVRGRDVLNLGHRMVKELFDNYGAVALRAYIKTRLKASRWACRQLGFKRVGMITFPDGDENELLVLTKDEFLNTEKEK